MPIICVFFNSIFFEIIKVKKEPACIFKEIMSYELGQTFFKIQYLCRVKEYSNEQKITF